MEEHKIPQNKYFFYAAIPEQVNATRDDLRQSKSRLLMWQQEYSDRLCVNHRFKIK